MITKTKPDKVICREERRGSVSVQEGIGLQVHLQDLDCEYW